MKKLLLQLFCFLVFCGSVFPQSAADSLKVRLNECTNLTERVALLNQLSYALNYADAGQAIAYAREAIGLASRLRLPSGVAAGYRNLAIVYQNLARYDSALLYADFSLRISGELKDSVAIAGGYTTMGNIRCYLSEFPQAILYYEKAYEIYSREGLISRAATLLGNIAWANSEMSNNKKALEIYFRALKMQEESRNEQGKALTLNNIGIVYFNLKNFDKALEYYHKALEIRERINDPFGIASSCSNIGNALGMKGKSGQAKPFFERALVIFKEKQDINSMAVVYSQIGHYLLEEGKDQEGMEYLRKSIRINEESGNMHSLAYVLLEYAMVQLKNGDHKQALTNLTHCREIFSETDNPDMLSQVYEGLALYYEKTGQYRQALQYFKEFSRIRDSIFTGESHDRVAAAEWQYESEKTNTENVRLSRDKVLTELAAQRHRQSRNVFIALAVILLVTLFLIVHQYRLKRRLSAILQAQNKDLEVKGKQIERQKEKIENQFNKLKELDELKTRFFANISHEFRTPLTLIGGPIEEILKSDQAILLPGDMTAKLTMTLRNVRQLKNLTNQMLDLSRLKAGKMKLRTTLFELAGYLRRTINTFESAIPGNKSIQLRYQSEVERIWIHLDPEKIDQIINNLISNAIKSIDQEGEIVVNLSGPSNHELNTTHEGSFVTVTISDNGRGISAVDLSRIFDRFFRADDSSLSQEPGTGIGLELTRDLVELHGGSIHVSSEPGKGSCFTVHFPLGTDHLEADEVIGTEVPENRESAASGKGFLSAEHAPLIPAGKSRTLLIVEDHPDMRAYIAGFLSAEFNLLEAADGLKAWETIRLQKPDLVISDLMMPGMDGLTLLEQTRDFEETRHIPFILLTAKAGDDEKLAGYALKADAYITKPFQAEELLLRIRHLLETHQELRETFSRKVLSVDLNNDEIPPADQQFLGKVKDLVVNKMADSGFGIRQLASDACLSERQLRRKISDLTGLTPVDFIRQIRLQQAKQLIEQQAYPTISEISVAVGFNNPAYFSRLFKKLFGYAPTDLFRPE
ncbi:MAG: tetratricopeptide repeat protein [Alphaproteobacteria bacterium]|nr:tetratricopeptide repeat protein [Alphaproteobacteria bacterium]